MKVENLTGKALDWAVGDALGMRTNMCIHRGTLYPHYVDDRDACQPWAPSRYADQAMPVIEDVISDIVIDNRGARDDGRVHAYINSLQSSEICCWGPTVPVACMRAFVKSKFGDEYSNFPEALGVSGE